MNPIFDLKGEHEAMAITLSAMKKIASDIHAAKSVDLQRIEQIIEFLETFNHSCHQEKEEQILFPALLECDIPWTADVISHLINEHSMLRKYLADINNHLQDYLSKRRNSLEDVATSLTNYISLSESHTNTENTILFPLAERVFSKSKKDTIFVDFRTIQDTRIGHSKHLEYYILLTKLYSDVRVVYVEEYF